MTPPKASDLRFGPARGVVVLGLLSVSAVVLALLFMHPREIGAQEGGNDPTPRQENQRRLILLYGYWPPTDIGVEGRAGILDTWKTRGRYKDSNYDVLAITPEFTARKGTYAEGEDLYLFSGLRACGEVGEAGVSAAEQVGEHLAEIAALLAGGAVDAGQAGVGQGPAFGSAAA
jgi:hypothetical protein